MTIIPTMQGKFQILRLESERSGEHLFRITFDKFGASGRGAITGPLARIYEPKAIFAELINAGANVQQTDQVQLGKALAESLPDSAGRLFEIAGWHDVGAELVFAIGDDVIGATSEPSFYLAPKASYAGAQEGSLAKWKRKVAAPALLSPYAGLALIVSLAAPLLKFSDLSEGAIFNLTGPSSAGKSTANKVAASVWGKPKLPGWDMSDTGRQEVVVSCCDLCAILDDTDTNSKGTPENRLRALYSAVDPLTNGEGRVRSRTVESQLPDVTYRMFGLSSTQEAVEDFTRRTNAKRSDGNRVRLLEIRVPHGDVGGIFRGVDLKPFRRKTTAGASKKLADACKAYHGVAGRKFVEYLIANRATLPVEVAKLQRRFVSKFPHVTGGVESRILGKCSLIYAASKLASRAGILPVQNGGSFRLARFAFEQIIATAFGQPDDLKEALRELIAATKDRQRFQRVESMKDVDPSAEGFVHLGNGRLYMRLDALRAILGNDAEKLTGRVLHQLSSDEALLGGHGKRTGQNCRVGPDQSPLRFLAFDWRKFRKATTGSPSRSARTKRE